MRCCFEIPMADLAEQELSRLLSARGVPGSEDQLAYTVECLSASDIIASGDLAGLGDIGNVPEIDLLEDRLLVFLQSVVDVSMACRPLLRKL